MYIAKDLQFIDHVYFQDKQTFKTKEELAQALINHHSQDNNMETEQNLLNNDHTQKCLETLKDFEWQIIDLNNEEQCTRCNKWVKNTKIYQTHEDNDHPDNKTACGQCFLTKLAYKKAII